MSSGPRQRPPPVWILVAVIILLSLPVAFTVFPIDPSGICHGCGGITPIGSAVNFGHPGLPSQCGVDSTFSGNGCAAGHYEYVVEVESSTIGLGSVNFAVRNATGMADRASAGLGFSIFNATETILAQSAVQGGWMASNVTGWTYVWGATRSTPLLPTDTIVIDLGTADPEGQGLTFIGIGSGPYSGTTVALTLP